MLGAHGTRDEAWRRDRVGAFCRHDRPRVAGAAGGRLGGLTFAAKDVFAVRGITACFGNPTWHATHSPASRHAPAIEALLDAGATLAGVTITDELALSLTGENAHYGTPANVRCPERVPGGSSSGSAAAVAARLVDFALGTDTGGSVRVPASHCGVAGFRPTHGAVAAEGVLPLAPRFDTVGWLAHDAATLARVGDVLLPHREPSRADSPHARARPRRLLVPRDLGSFVDPATRLAFARAARILAARLGCPLDPVVIDPAEAPMASWLGAYLTLQNAELAAHHGTWLRQESPKLGTLIGGRVAGALAAAGADGARAALAAAETTLAALAAFVLPLVDGDRWLVWPSATGAAPPRGLEDAVTNEATGRGLTLGALASLTGLPQVSVPGADVDGCPFGISLVGPPGADRALLAAVATLDERWLEEIANATEERSP